MPNSMNSSSLREYCDNLNEKEKGEQPQHVPPSKFNHLMTFPFTMRKEQEQQHPYRHPNPRLKVLSKKKKNYPCHKKNL